METLLAKTQTQALAIHDYAIEIGNHLIETALWNLDKTQCNWLGRRDILEAELRAYASRSAALSPEFYSGTAGIALFLVELYGQTGEQKFLATALAALNRSISYIKNKTFAASPISFYAGDLGLLYVATRFEKLDALKKINFNANKQFLINRIIHGFDIAHGLDRIGGNAGAIAVLFKLAHELEIEELYNTAVKCADELVNLAKWEQGFCLWEAKKVHGVEINNPPMTGFSHGAAGIGLSLLEAFSYTNNQIYLDHGRGAFQFEQTLFNNEENNWIDTRYPHFKRNGKITGTFRSAWCHGAPGTALAHAKASHIDKSMTKFHIDMAERALSTTISRLKENILHPEKDATLCHGTLGLAEILLICGQLLNKDNLVQSAQVTTESLLNKVKSPLNLSCGLNCGGYSPSIMTGLSGIGHHFIRLYSYKSVPSVLLID